VIIGLVGMPIAALVKLIPVSKKPFPETRYFRWLNAILGSRKRRRAQKAMQAKKAAAQEAEAAGKLMCWT
jgi:hypothetical protein